MQAVGSVDRRCCGLHVIAGSDPFIPTTDDAEPNLLRLTTVEAMDTRLRFLAQVGKFQPLFAPGKAGRTRGELTEVPHIGEDSPSFEIEAGIQGLLEGLEACRGEVAGLNQLIQRAVAGASGNERDD